MDVPATVEPLFSILVANFNNGRYLGQLLESVHAQTYANWELIVTEDASNDESPRVLSDCKADSRIRVVSHVRNQGAGAAFASAAQAAAGTLMGMLGADDALRPEAIRRMVDAHLRHPDASLINSDLLICDSDLKPTGQPSDFGPLPLGESLIRNCCVSSFATFKASAYRRTPGFNPSFRRAVDHDIYLKLEEVGVLHYVNEPLYLYRMHAGGISQGINGIKAAQFALLARADAYRRRKGTKLPNLTRGEFRDLMSTYHRRQADMCTRRDPKDALRHLARSALYQPSLCLRPGFWKSAGRHLVGLAAS